MTQNKIYNTSSDIRRKKYETVSYRIKQTDRKYYSIVLTLLVMPVDLGKGSSVLLW
jgi:hypothetical protein